ncbi:MAG: hypothetical protein ABSF23_04280 [Terracidiphilus sp.]|jgi:hypothetical protein
MTRKWLIPLGALVAAAGLAVHTVRSASGASGGSPKVIDRDSIAYGRTYSQWSAAWEQWVGSIPTARNPLFDNSDCSTGQSGPVWFLGGKFCPNGEACSYDHVVRSCAVPAGKALFFPILNVEDSALEERLAENPGKPEFQQISVMRKIRDASLANARVSCTVDGAAVLDLQERYRVQSDAFSFTLPADNYFTSFYGTRFPEGSFFPAVADGWYLMLAPLPLGHHVLKFRGVGRAFTVDVQYNLNVQ